MIKSAAPEQLAGWRQRTCAERQRAFAKRQRAFAKPPRCAQANCRQHGGAWCGRQLGRVQQCSA